MGKRADAWQMTIHGERVIVLSVPEVATTTLPRGTLTKTEEHIAKRAARGESNAEIARARKTSPRTVANQLARIYAKLGVRSRVELAALLRRLA
ncbi:MAG TPA: LuxR C-terminal-related transcriptional regulator [Polyangiaceae bacterium]|jgi:DNA-binding CsgD family transcriptional regulator|nr:LuxR C-terminal-related transcriptional regulator [Polyangiaceae bacterium]